VFEREPSIEVTQTIERMSQAGPRYKLSPSKDPLETIHFIPSVKLSIWPELGCQAA
jgi:hypothetical protein